MNKAVTFGLLCVVIISLVPSDAQKCSIKKKQLKKAVCELIGQVSGLKEHVKKAEEADTTSRLNELETLVNNLTGVVNALKEKVQSQEEKPTPDASCPSGFITHGSSCYFISKEKKPWTDAKKTCNSMDAYLVEITSREENTFLSVLIPASVYSYIGATDVDQEGQFVWAQSGCNLGFTNWHKEDPDNYDGKENCAVMNTDGLWGDVQCQSPFLFICEKSDVSVG